MNGCERLAISLIVAWTAVPLLAQEQPPPTVKPPRVQSWNVQEHIEGFGDLGEITLHTLGKQLEIRWIKNGPEGEYLGSHFETFDLSFWPTATYSLDGSRILIVAGKRPSNGNTVMERWEFQPWTQAPSAQVPTPAPTKAVFFDQKDPHQEEVIDILHWRPSTHKVLVQFASSGRLYGVNTMSGDTQLLYTPQDVPGLFRPAHNMMGGEHPDYGNIYSLQCVLPGAPSEGILVFFDKDKDGAIDSWQDYDSDAWVKVFGVPSTWIEKW